MSAEMHAYYAGRAPYYDDVYLKPERKEDIAYLSEHLPEQFRDRRVLEVACGTGYWTQHIAKSASSMVATDYLAEPLEFAKLRPGTEAVVFRQADAYALPGDIGVFDGLFAGLWFSHIPVERRAAFLERIHAELQPGSKVIFMDNNAVQKSDYGIVDTDAHGNTYQMRPLKNGSTHRVLKNFPTENELVTSLSKYGQKVHFSMLQNFWMVAYEVR